jgi:hypothetical protein
VKDYKVCDMTGSGNARTATKLILEFNVHGSVHRNNILIYIQQDGTLHSLFYLETALYVSGGMTTHHQESKQLYLQHLVFPTPLPLPSYGSRNGLTYQML